MQRLIAAAVLMSLSSLALAEPSIDCSGLSAPQVIQSATAVAPVAGELGTPEQPLGVAGGVLDQPATDALSAEQVLYRQQLERCAQVATATAPAVPGVVPAADAMPAAPVAEGMVASTMPAATPAPEVIDAATYKPRTEFDNTPWRFNMNQNGMPDQGSLRMIDYNGPSEAAANQAYEAGRRAILMCARDGYDLPAEKYSHWRDVIIDFRPDGAGVR